MWAAETEPAVEVLKSLVVPSPQSTETQNGPVPPVKEPSAKVTDAPSFELWFPAGVKTGGAPCTLTVCVPVLTLPYASVAV